MDGNTVAMLITPPEQPFKAPFVHDTTTVTPVGVVAVTAVAAVDATRVALPVLAVDATELREVSVHVRDTVKV